MSDPAFPRLPDRPSLDQLRKQAKELLRAWREGEAAALARIGAHKPSASAPKLADAQFAIARELGFESWPRLAHHLESPPADLQHFDRLAADVVAAYGGDANALARVNDGLLHARSVDELRAKVQQHREPSAEAADSAALGLDEGRLLVARTLGFSSWASLADNVARPAVDPRRAPHGLSTRPPFYRVDWETNTIEPRQPLAARDWELLIDVVRDHGLTAVNARGQMTDEALERLSRVEHVTSLNLGGCRRLTDAGLSHLARLPQLEELDLSDYPGGLLTDRGLAVLQHLHELRRFQMCWYGGISDAGVANLAACDKLERVDLLGSPTGDGVLAALGGKPRLRQLKTGRQVTDAGLERLHDFPVFRTWQGGEPKYSLMSFGDTDPNFLMVDGPFSNAGFAALATLEGLFGLGFFWHVSALTSDALRCLVDLPHLGALACEGSLCDDTAMGHIAALPRLRMLMAQGTVASDQGFRALSGSPTIEYIWGRDCPNLQSRGFAALASMPSLAGLAVSCKAVDDGALSALPSFPALRWLLPMDVRDEGFRHIGRCQALEKLTCMYCRDTGDAATGHLAGLTRLAHYYAGATQITDRSLEILGGIRSLEEVQLSSCAGISDAGLVHLAGLPRLKQVSVDATARVTRAGLAVFPASVRVDFFS